MYVPEYFEAHEFVDRATYEKYGERSLMFMDQRIVWAVDQIREALDTGIIINDWKWGGNYEWSGLRTKESPWYNPYSQHSFGRALDIKVKDMDAEEVREVLMNAQNPIAHITAIELDTPTWVHIDCRNVKPNHESGYYLFSP